MFAALVSCVINLVAKPQKTWRQLVAEKEWDNDGFYRTYFHPLVGIVALAVFVGAFVSTKSFPLSLKAVICETVSLFGSLYLSAFLIKTVAEKVFQTSLLMGICEKFTGYSSAPVYIAAILSALLPSFSLFTFHFSLFTFISFYSLYIIWRGSTEYLGINAENSTKFTIFAGTIVVMSPQILRIILYAATK
jgi:hypothetical protein